MKVIRNNEKYQHICEMNPGKVFECSSEYYMKIRDVKRGADQTYNAVCLENGSLWKFEENTNVRIVAGSFVEGER